MEAIVHEAHTEIFPDRNEINEYCKIGKGADCCIFLVVGSQFECCYYNRLPIMELIERARAGLTNARREGCNKVKDWTPTGIGEVEF